MSEWSILKENLKLGNQIKVAICPFNIILGQFLTSLLKDCLILKQNVHVIWFCYSLTYYTLDIMKSEVAQSCPTLCGPMNWSQASLSITNSRSSPKPMSTESVMPSSHLILCRPLLLLPSIFPSIRVFSNESALHIRWPKYWFQCQHQSFQ